MVQNRCHVPREVRPMSRIPSLNELRARLVAEQLVARDITDPQVLKAMGTVPREKFVPDYRRHLAYED